MGAPDLFATPATTGRSPGAALYAPFHPGNWALAASSVFLGPGFAKDPSSDIQAMANQNLVFFEGEVPAWGLRAGEPGARVIVEISDPGKYSANKDGYCIANGLVPVLAVRCVHFQRDEELKNFLATYEAFDDVPVKLVPMSVTPALFNSTDEKPLAPLPGKNIALEEERARLLRVGGLCIAIVDLLQKGKHDKEILGVEFDLSHEGIHGVFEGLLRAFMRRDDAIEQQAWKAVVHALLPGDGAPPGDQLDLLDKVASELGTGEVARQWVSVTRQVLQGMTDMPAMADTATLGRRAALAAIVHRDIDAAEGFVEQKGSGRLVTALVKCMAYACEGLGRAPSRLKGNAETLGAAIKLANALMSGECARLEARSQARDRQLVLHDKVFFGKMEVLARSIDPDPSETLLLSRARESGRMISVGENGRLVLVTEGPDPIEVNFDIEGAGDDGRAVIRFSTRLGSLPARTPAKALTDVMQMAWDRGVGIGLVQEAKRNYLVAFVNQPTGTLDGDEFEFYLERLADVSRCYGAAKMQTLAAKTRRKKIVTKE